MTSTIVPRSVVEAERRRAQAERLRVGLAARRGEVVEKERVRTMLRRRKVELESMLLKLARVMGRQTAYLRKRRAVVDLLRRELVRRVDCVYDRGADELDE